MAAGNVFQMASDGDAAMRALHKALAGDPDGAAQDLLSEDPRFGGFVRQCQAESAEKVAQRHGINIESILGLLSGRKE